MLDCFRRNINYLRISLTDRCNLRCTYCMPEKGRSYQSSDELLTDEEIIACVKVAAKYGVTKIRFTGGEPLLRNNLCKLIGSISAVKGIQDISITTNGILLKKYAASLAGAGLKRINISLDTIDPGKYSLITRGGNIADVFEGINAAKEADLYPVKINCVIEESRYEPHAQEVEKYCIENNLEIRFIRQMNLEKGVFYPVEGGEGGNCCMCNRMRLTANGFFKPCLFDPAKYSIRDLGVETAFIMAIRNKPEKGTSDKVSEFYNIGG